MALWMGVGLFYSVSLFFLDFLDHTGKNQLYIPISHPIAKCKLFHPSLDMPGKKN